jgi:pilus assembly protein CpaB
MGRRSVLLIVAVVIAALGAAMVFLYVQGINDRAVADQTPVQVLAATDQIEAGETIEAAQAAGKLNLVDVPRANVLPGALTTTDALTGEIALTTIFKGEQILPGRFGISGSQQSLTIPDGNIAISIQLDDPARVAGFINPGSDVVIFTDLSSGAATTAEAAAAASGTGNVRVLLPKVQVIGVGATTVLSTTTTDPTGTETVEQIARTILTLSVSQDQAERVIYANENSKLTLGLLNDKSKVRPGPGVSGANLFN